MKPGSTVWKLPAGNVFHAFAATNARFRFRGNPFIVTGSTVTKNIVTVRFLQALLPFLQLYGSELRLKV